MQMVFAGLITTLLASTCYEGTKHIFRAYDKDLCSHECRVIQDTSSVGASAATAIAPTAVVPPARQLGASVDEKSYSEEFDKDLRTDHDRTRTSLHPMEREGTRKQPFSTRWWSGKVRGSSRSPPEGAGRYDKSEQATCHR